MTRIEKIMSVLIDEYDVKPNDVEELKALIIANACPKTICWDSCDINKRIQCWKGEYKK